MSNVKEEIDREIEHLIRAKADNAIALQKVITENEDVERWVAEGHLEFLEKRIFAGIEREAFATIKNPAFDPASLSQVAQLKGLCQAIDLIRSKIGGIVSEARQARSLLQDLKNSTLKEGE